MCDGFFRFWNASLFVWRYLPVCGAVIVSLLSARRHRLLASIHRDTTVSFLVSCSPMLGFFIRGVSVLTWFSCGLFFYLDEKLKRGSCRCMCRGSCKHGSGTVQDGNGNRDGYGCVVSMFF